MSEMLTLAIGGEERKVPAGTTFLTLAREYQKDYKNPIILANLDQKLYELGKVCKRGGTLTFVTTGEPAGHKTYVRGAQMMFLRAMFHLYGRETLKKVQLEYAMGDGYFFEVDSTEPVTEEMLSRVEAQMREYVRADEVFEKINMNTDEVRELFRRHGMMDKDRLFRYRRVSHTNIYRLGNFEDYFYGYMPPSAGMLKEFYLKPYEGGIMLVLPSAAAPEKPGELMISEKLFRTQRRTNEWGQKMGLDTVGALNDAISAGNSTRIILGQEAHQERLIGEIAGRIAREHKRIVMIAGPSSSGKTSFSHRLSIQLENCGLRAHPIAIDNYFVERERTPRDEHGDYDYECLEALDIQQFNEQMTALLRGDRINMPTFNFKLGRQEFNGDTMKLGKDEVLVIEGIHGLNDRLSYGIDPDNKFKIYISALTQLNIDEHNRIPTTDTRLIRRMVRDARTRGSSARDTIARWPSVRRGEDVHIFPFQEEADVMFNSALIYELAVLKVYAEPLLFGIPADCKEYVEAKRLLKFLEYFLGMSSEDVPRNSLLREFVGGSLFKV